METGSNMGLGAQSSHTATLVNNHWDYYPRKHSQGLLFTEVKPHFHVDPVRLNEYYFISFHVIKQHWSVMVPSCLIHKHKVPFGIRHHCTKPSHYYFWQSTKAYFQCFAAYWGRLRHKIHLLFLDEGYSDDPQHESSPLTTVSWNENCKECKNRFIITSW